MHHPRPTLETAAVLGHLLARWPELQAAVQSCLERHGPRGVPCLARTLRRAFGAWRAALVRDPLLWRLVRFALTRVDWKHVADQLLTKELRRQARAEEDALTQLLLERQRRLPS